MRGRHSRRQDPALAALLLGTSQWVWRAVEKGTTAHPGRKDVGKKQDAGCRAELPARCLRDCLVPPGRRGPGALWVASDGTRQPGGAD